jgi:hypothetical protein
MSLLLIFFTIITPLIMFQRKQTEIGSFSNRLYLADIEGCFRVVLIIDSSFMSLGYSIVFIYKYNKSRFLPFFVNSKVK